MKIDKQKQMHKFLNDLLQDLKFKCTNCSRVMPYSVIKGHKARQECYPISSKEEDMVDAADGDEMF